VIMAHSSWPVMPPLTGSLEGAGTYRWNAPTNELTYSVAVNTDGAGDLSNPSPAQTSQYPFVIDSAWI
jgi:hypothetical protein